MQFENLRIWKFENVGEATHLNELVKLNCFDLRLTPYALRLE